MNKPIVTFIVPIYNVEQYLVQCLDSIFAIEESNIEVLLINDGSTDSSESIANNYLKKHAKTCKLITQVNGGLSCARNTGLDYATGQWVIFVDSDDYVDPECLVNVMDQLKNSTADVVAYDVYKYIDETGDLQDMYREPNPFIGKGVVTSQQYLDVLFDNRLLNFVTIWDKAYRRDVLEHHSMRFIDGRIYEDVPFTFELFLKDINVEFVDEKVLYYRIREGSIMTTPSKDKLKHIIENIKMLQTEFIKKGYTQPVYFDYLIMHAKAVIKGGCKVPFSLLFTLLKNRITFKKNLVMLSLIARNIFLKE